MLVTWLRVSCIYHDFEKTWESYRPGLSVMTCHIGWLRALSLWLASWWLYLIDSIRPVLGLEAETRVLGINWSTLALQCAIQEVARVKLDPRLGGVHFQYPPASSMIDPGDKAKPHNGTGQKSRQGQVEAGKQLWDRHQTQSPATKQGQDRWRRQRAWWEILAAS